MNFVVSTSRFLKIIVLIIITTGMASWFLVLNNLSTQAAPPLQGPITTLGINHQCNENPLNDTYEAATLLQAGQPQPHTLDSGGDGSDPDTHGTHDKDWFIFAVPAGHVFTLSTTIPTTSVLTMTEISLFTSTSTAQSDHAAATSLSGELGWTASISPVTQSFWARVRNPFAAGQDDTNHFCDVIYNIRLILPGDLDNPDTRKSGKVGPNRTLTYTIMLHNTGEMLEPVTVTDTFPTGVNVLAVTVSPSSVTTMLLTSTTSLTWVGQAPGYSSIQFSVNTTVTEGAGPLLTNTVWIQANKTISRTSKDISPGPEPSGRIFLPIIFKS